MANKLTKKEIINSMLADETISANETWAGYLAHELELLEKKATSKKATKVQTENVATKEIILSVLSEIGSGTVTDIQNANAELSELSNQKISALLRQLIDDGKVQKTVEKKKSIFSLIV